MMRTKNTHNTNKILKKMFCLTLCFAMVFTQISLVTYAQETTPEESTQVQNQQPQYEGISMSSLVNEETSEEGEISYIVDDAAYNSNSFFAIGNEDDWKAFSIITDVSNDSTGTNYDLKYTFSGKTVYLDSDIDLSEVENQAPIGKVTSTSVPKAGFKGTFDGQNHVIVGININTSNPLAGLFSQIAGNAVLKNFTAIGSVTSTATSGNVGGIVGQFSNTSVTISNITSNIAVTGTSSQKKAGIVGSAGATASYPTLIEKSIFKGSVDGGAQVGGIICSSNAAGITVKGCANLADITIVNPQTDGALCGGQGASPTLIGCFSTAENVYILPITSTTASVSGCYYIGSSSQNYGTPISSDEASTSKLVWLLNNGAGEVIWMNGTDGHPEIADNTAKPIYRIAFERYGNGAQVVNISSDNEGKYEEVGNSWFSDSEIELTVSVSTEGAEDLVIKPYGDEGTTIEEVNKDAKNVTYKIKATSGNVLVKYGPVTEYENVLNTDWYNSSASEFTLTTPGEMLGLAKLVNDGNDFSGKTIKLDKDIVISEGTQWEPIGNTSSVLFKGTFDGNNHSITGINVSLTTAGVGLFGYISGATVENLKLLDGEIKTTASSGLAGAIAGSAIAGSTIRNCTNKNVTVTASGASSTAGGIVGVIKGVSSGAEAVVENCINDAAVSAGGNAGGIAGGSTNQYGLSIKYCQNTGSVKCTGTSATKYGGGIIGQLNGASDTAALIAGCQNLGAVTKSKDVATIGAIAGYNAKGSIRASMGYINGNSSVDLVGKNGTATYEENYNLGKCTATYGVESSADDFKAITLVANLNDALGTSFFGYGYDDTHYAYPIFADNGKNGVFIIKVDVLSGDPTVKVSDVKEKKSGSYYGKSDMKGELTCEGKSFMVIQNGKINIYKDSVKVSITDENGDKSNISIICGSQEELENVETTQWYNESQSTFELTTPGQLLGLSTLVNEGKNFDGKTVKLGNDIDLSGVCDESNPWKPIGWWYSSSVCKYFSGTFDGCGNTISGLYAYKDSNAASQTDRMGKTLGLFGATDSATLKNFTVEGEVVWEQAETSASSGGVGGVLGLNYRGDISLQNITSEVTVTSKAFNTGGIVGNADQGGGATAHGAAFSAKSLVNKGNVTYNGTAAAYTGGVIGALQKGYQGKGEMTLSCNKAEVLSTATGGYCGGIIGAYMPHASYKDGGYFNITDIKNCYNSGNVYGAIAAGMIAYVKASGIANAAANGQPIVQNIISSGSVYGKTKTYATVNDGEYLQSGNVGVNKISKASKNLIFDKEKIFTCTSFDEEGIETAESVSEYQGNDIVTDGVTTEELKSGKIAYILDNGGTNLARAGIWGQNVTTSLPEFASIYAPAVYKVKTISSEGGSLAQTLQSNAVLGNETSGDGKETDYYIAGTTKMTFKVTCDEDYLLDSFHAMKDGDGSELDANLIENEASDGEPVSYTVILTIPAGTDVTINADFCNAPETLGQDMTLIFDANGGRFQPGAEEDSTKSVNTTVGTRYNTIDVIKDGVIPENGDYEFLGWFLDKECTQKVDITKMIIPTSSENLQVILYAGWDTTSTYYKVKLNPGDGEFSEGITTAEDGTFSVTVKMGRIPALTKYQPVKAGFTFSGWYYDEEHHMPYGNEAITAETTLYAAYQATGASGGGSAGDTKNKYIITFNGNGGYFTSGNNKVTSYQATAEEGSNVSLDQLNVPVPSRNLENGVGYVFKGWFTNTEPAVPEVSWTGTENINENITLYAHWEEISDFDQYMGENGESEATPVVISDYATLTKFKTYVNQGHDCKGKYISLGASFLVKSDWSAINSFAGTFDGKNFTLTYDGVNSSLFGKVTGTVKNLNIAGSGTVSGGIANSLGNGGTVENCKILKGTVLNGGDLGGIVGNIGMESNGSYIIRDCQVEDGVVLNGNGSYVGGILGRTTGFSANGVKIENCKVGKATITGAGETSGNVGGLGGILGYGGMVTISGCKVAAEIKPTSANASGVGGIVGCQGSTQGTLTIEKSGFSGKITIDGEAASVGGIIGGSIWSGSNVTAKVDNVYSTGEITVGSVKSGSHTGGIVGNNNNEGNVTITNSYWYGKYTDNSGSTDGFGAITDNTSGVNANNTYYYPGDGSVYESTQGTSKDNTFFTSGEAAYVLDGGGSGNRNNAWTQGEGLPGIGQPPIYKVSVDASQEVTWPDGTTATITTTITSSLGSGSTVYVKGGETVQISVSGLPADKVVTASDGSTTTTKYTVDIKDIETGTSLSGATISKDLSGTGAGSSSSTVKPGSGNGNGDGTTGGDDGGNGDGNGEGTGNGDGNGNGDGTGAGGNGNGGTGSGNTNTGVNGGGNQTLPNDEPLSGGSEGSGTVNNTSTQNITESVDKTAVEKTTVDAAENQEGNNSESGGQTGGNDGNVFKIITDAVKNNPVVTLALIIAVLGIIILGAVRRKKKEE